MTTPARGGHDRRTLDDVSTRRLLLCCLLLVAATVSWRRGVYFEGGLDPVVAAKGVVSVAAFLLALGAARAAPAPHPRGSRTLVLVTTYAAVATLGALVAGDPLPSAVLGVRVVLLASTVHLLLRACPATTVARAMFASMGAVGLLAAASGAGTLAGGRLSGGVVPLAPNELAGLCGLALLLVVWEGVRRPAMWQLALGAVLLGVVWLTGSRTALATVVPSSAVLLVLAPRVPRAVFAGVACAVPVLGYLVLASPLLADFLQSDRGSGIGTLNSRTVAWSAAIDYPRSELQRWLGAGLSVKRIPVSGQYWNEQIFDSSWVSALVQAGLVGLAILLVLAASALVCAVRATPAERGLWAAVVVFCVGRSLLESGLMDATPAFLALVLAAMATEPAGRRSMSNRHAEWPATPSMEASRGGAGSRSM